MPKRNETHAEPLSLTVLQADFLMLKAEVRLLSDLFRQLQLDLADLRKAMRARKPAVK